MNTTLINLIEELQDNYRLLITTNTDDEISLNDARDKYLARNISEKLRTQIEPTINRRLNNFRNETIELIKRDDIHAWLKSFSGFLIILLYWLFSKKTSLSKERISELCEALILGIIGYRIIDIKTDTNSVGIEKIYIGNYIIGVYEEMLIDIFKDLNAKKIINKHLETFTKIEYEEKSNRWEKSIYDWENPVKLGYKTSPLFAHIELAAIRSGMPDKNINILFDGLMPLVAAIQFMDDISDAKEDLENGIETLIMSGFFNEYGSNVIVTENLVEEFITQEKLIKYCETIEELFNLAREKFILIDDKIFLLLTEIQNLKFHSSIQLIS